MIIMNKHIIIAGLPKCGTSSLHYYLTQHPDIITPKKKEIRFFNQNNDYHIKTYKKLLNGNDKDKYTIDSTPYYSWRFNFNVPLKIKNYLPETKIILMFRNPADRLFSNFLMNNPNGDINKEYNKYLKNPVQKNISQYSKILNNWNYFDNKKNLKVILSEDLYSNELNITNEIFKFLNLYQLTKIHTKIISPKKPRQFIKMTNDTRKKILEIYKDEIINFEKTSGLETKWLNDK